MSPLLAWQLRRRDPPRVQRCTLPVPPTANHRLRPGLTAKGKARLFLSKDARGYKKQCELLTAKLIPHPLPARVRIRLVWRLGADQRGDIDNRIKSVLDVLKGRAYQDDRQVRRLHVYAEETADSHSLILVTITLLPPARIR